MAMFTLKLETSNDAFGDMPGPELSRILREVSERIVFTNTGACQDINGNTVGEFHFDHIEHFKAIVTPE